MLPCEIMHPQVGSWRPVASGDAGVVIGKLSQTNCGRRLASGVLLLGIAVTASVAGAEEVARKVAFEEVSSLLKTRCVKCHGPAKAEKRLNLSTPAGILRGSEAGPVVTPHDRDASPLWSRVHDGSMPPDDVLSEEEQGLLSRWIESGAPGLSTSSEGEHWAFRPLGPADDPAAKGAGEGESLIDRFLQLRLQAEGLTLGGEADRESLLRRVSLVVTGLPPTLAEQRAFLADQEPDAYERVVDRLLSSPQAGIRWGRLWLDATGYADSNGYFNADSDRPLAWRYRDWVVQSINADMPFDEFLKAQVCGDELAGVEPGREVTPQEQGLLVATHFLRNGQDGTGESDGNAEEVRADKYFALESCQQNVMSSLLGLTFQCAKCHDHKFEPILQEDYYRLQAIFAPVFPIDSWKKPNERFVLAPLAGETARWNSALDSVKSELEQARLALADYARLKRPVGEVLFRDDFDRAVLGPDWSNRLPGDEQPAGKVPVQLDSRERPGAFLRDGRLVIAEGNTQGDSLLSTSKALAWLPAEVGAAVQVTFDLVSNRSEDSDSPAERIGYLVALRDFADQKPDSGGNLLIDGHPQGGSTVHLDYPGTDSRSVGVIGAQGHVPGRNFGIRLTRLEEDKVRVESLVDFLPDGKSIELPAADVPAGGFGFEYCCNRSFVVDNLRIEAFPPEASSEPLKEFLAGLRALRQRVDELSGRLKSLESQPPGKIAWVSDLVSTPPEVRLLSRGNYGTPAHVVAPGPPRFLAGGANVDFSSEKGKVTTGSRLSFVDWMLTSPQARALLARTQVNRLWQGCFGAGIVLTTENLGQSGSPPSHPELLEYLANRFVEGGWRMRPLLREMLLSRAFRQSSLASDAGLAADPSNRLLWRFSPLRLDADMIRDSLLHFAGHLDPSLGGSPIPTQRTDSGEVVVAESEKGHARRSLYLYQRRTQVVGLLQLFDSPQIVFNSTRRSRSTIPLQSLALLNSEFMIHRAEELVGRLERDAVEPSDRIELLWRLCLGRAPDPEERASAREFLAQQAGRIEGPSDTTRQAWRDLCQSVMTCSEALYLR